MKKIQLLKSTLELPDSWDDLNEKQAQFVFAQLILLFNNKISEFEFQTSVLFNFTGYKPSIRRKIRFFLKNIWVWVYHRVLRGKKDKFEFIEIEYEIEQNIQFNLIQLAEQINFAFSVDENQIVPNYNFCKNPLPSYVDVYFNRDITVETNITSKQYADCVDLIRGYQECNDEKTRLHCLKMMIYKLSHRHWSDIGKLPDEVLFGIMFWFTSIVRFFKEHPVYGVLYKRKSADDDEDGNKIDLGMSEILLFLEKEGYAFVEEKNLIDFFNAQVKALKDSVSKALASGAKITDLSKSTGLDIGTLNRLK